MPKYFVVQISFFISSTKVSNSLNLARVPPEGGQMIVGDAHPYIFRCCARNNGKVGLRCAVVACQPSKLRTRKIQF